MTLIFSNNKYYKNYDFVRLMRNYNKYCAYDFSSESPDVAIEWFSVLMDDFYEGAIQWLKEYRK